MQTLPRVALVKESANAKTGRIAVSTTESTSCPSTCPLINSGCYAKSGRTRLHWTAVDTGKRGMTWNDFIESIDTLKRGSMFRHNEAGDLPHNSGTINNEALEQLTSALSARNIRGFTYTHHVLNTGNVEAIRAANASGFTVNLSLDNPHDIDSHASLGLPMVCLVPDDGLAKRVTPKGNVIVRCPAEYREGIQCIDCKLCAVSDRRVSVGFTPHGTGKKKAALATQNTINTIKVINL